MPDCKTHGMELSYKLLLFTFCSPLGIKANTKSSIPLANNPKPRALTE